MEYIGAADYWFWQGIKHGHLSKNDVLGYSSNPETYLGGRLGMPNNVNLEAARAFKDGFWLGEELMAQEYLDLTEIIHPVKVEIVKIEKELENTVNVPIEGNC